MIAAEYNNNLFVFFFFKKVFFFFSLCTLFLLSVHSKRVQRVCTLVTRETKVSVH
jgi:hypothetical protein